MGRGRVVGAGDYKKLYAELNEIACISDFKMLMLVSETSI